MQTDAAARRRRFVAFVISCALSHSASQLVFKRQRGATRWRVWGAAFTAICLCEGIVWGYAPLGLVTGQDFSAELICLIVKLGIAAGSIPAFGAYLPAYLALFLLNATDGERST